MPSRSAKQARFMNIVAHSPAFARKVGVAQSVGRDFHAADKARHRYGFAEGGLAQAEGSRARAQRNAPGFMDALGALGQMLYGGARGAAVATLGAPGELWRLGRAAREATMADAEGRRLDVALAHLAAPNDYLPTMSDIDRGLSAVGLRSSGTPQEKIAEFAPMTPGQVGRLAAPAGRAVRGALEQIAQPVPRRAAQLGAVRLKGGNFDQTRLTGVLNEIGVETGDPMYMGWVGDNARSIPTSRWADKQLRNYIAKDMGSTTDPLLAVEAEGRGLHLPDPDVLEQARRRGMSPMSAQRHWKLTEGRQATPWEYLTADEMLRLNPQQYLNNPETEMAIGLISPTGEGGRNAAENLALIKGLPQGRDAAEQAMFDALRKRYLWAENAPENTDIWSVSPDNQLGFDHLLDYLETAQNAGKYRTVIQQARDRGDELMPDEAAHAALIDAGLDLTPQQLERLSVADAVRRTRDWNAFMSENQSIANPGLARGWQVHKEYPDEGFKWVKFGGDPLTELPKGYSVKEYTPGRFSMLDPEGRYDRYNTAADTEEEALKRSLAALAREELAAGLNAEGQAMGHCVGGYCDQVARSGTQIYSLRDKAGNPHVTVEVRPQNEVSAAEDAAAKVLGLHSKRELRDAYNASPLENITYETWVKKHLPADWKAPVDIQQIKGKQNAAPVDRYLPYVQDFVRSGQWGSVGDLRNTGLSKRGDKYFTRDELLASIKAHPRFKELFEGRGPFPEGSAGYLVEHPDEAFGGHNFANILDMMDNPQFGLKDRPTGGFAEGGLVEADDEDDALPHFATAMNIQEPQPRFASAFNLNV